jgi:hypothetical protein
VLENADIASEEDTVLGGRGLNNLVIGMVIAIRRVEAGKSEIRREPAKMHVGTNASPACTPQAGSR